jgi:crossover junction endonuclease MUS81
MAQRRVTSAGKFQFWYVDSMGKRVDGVGSAMIRLDPEDFITLRKIELLESQRSHAFVSQLRLMDAAPSIRHGLSTLYAFVEEETAPPRCSRFDDPPAAAAPIRAIAARTHDHVPTPVSDDDDFVAMPTATSTKPASARLAPAANAVNGIHEEEPIEIDVRAKGKSVSRSLTLTKTFSDVAPPRPGPRLSSHVQIAHPLETTSSMSIADLPDFDPSKAMIFPSGSYEIILVLDTREIESKSNRDRFAEKLEAKGVKLETRALRLGDVLWIARKLDGMGGEEDECVLDYVLERKRLDDLCASMRDNRYHEQSVRR